MRVLDALLAGEVNVDKAFLLGGLPKADILRAFRPHIFFDDQEIYCIPASKVVSTGRVPGQPLRSQKVVSSFESRR
jgi:5'-nucleotidase